MAEYRQIMNGVLGAVVENPDGTVDVAFRVRVRRADGSAAGFNAQRSQQYANTKGMMDLESALGWPLGMSLILCERHERYQAQAPRQERMAGTVNQPTPSATVNARMDRLESALATIAESLVKPKRAPRQVRPTQSEPESVTVAPVVNGELTE